MANIWIFFFYFPMQREGHYSRLTGWISTEPGTRYVDGKIINLPDPRDQDELEEAAEQDLTM